MEVYAIKAFKKTNETQPEKSSYLYKRNEHTQSCALLHNLQHSSHESIFSY